MNQRQFFLLITVFSATLLVAQDKEEEKKENHPVYTSLSKALKHSNKVYKLDLRNTGLSSFPADIFKLENLEVLILDSNKLSFLPPQISLLKQLKVISLSYNQLETLPPEIGECNNIQVMYLDHNKLKTLPEKFYRLTNLDKLTLSHNELTELSKEVQFLKKLYVLDFGFNNLKVIPDEIGHAYNLSSLSFEGNQIKELPIHFYELTNLKVLFLGSNLFEKIDVGFEKFKKLEIMAIEKNKLKSISPSFGNLGSLKKMYISDNLLENFPNEMGNLYNLEILNMDDNPLKSIPATFKELRNLKTLYAKGIDIKPFPQVFYDMQNNGTKIDGLATKELYNVKLLASKGRNKKLVENYADAIPNYEEAIKMDTNNVIVYTELAQCYLAIKEFEKSEKYAKKALLKDPPAKLLPEIQLTLVSAQNKTNDEVGIIKAYENKWKADPKNVTPLFECGKYFYYNDKKEEAKTWFEKAVKTDPDHIQSHFYLAITHLSLDEKTPFILATLKYVIAEPKSNKTRTMLPFLFTRLKMKTGVEGKKGSTSYNDSYVIRDENKEVIYRSENSTSDLLAAMLSDIISTNLIKTKKNDNDSAKAMQNIVKEALNINKNNVDVFKVELKRLCENKPDTIPDKEKFTRDFYLPFYNELIEKGHLEALSYLLNNARREEDYILEWIKANPDKMKAFRDWYSNYKWPAKN